MNNRPLFNRFFAHKRPEEMHQSAPCDQMRTRRSTRFSQRPIPKPGKTPCAQRDRASVPTDSRGICRHHGPI